MEYTNEFLARVYGAYIGSNIIMPKSGRIAKLQGVDFDGATIHLNDGEDHRNFEYFPFKLILTPLSEISDEDAIEVAKIMYCKETPDAEYKIARVEDGTVVCINGVLDLSIYHDECHFVAKEADSGLVLPTLFAFEATDYLRYKGYDAGFSNIPSLIKAGIAVKTIQP